jgi:hypothetical protein
MLRAITAIGNPFAERDLVPVLEWLHPRKEAKANRTGSMVFALNMRQSDTSNAICA